MATKTNCPYCEFEVEAEDDAAVCGDCEVQFTVGWDMDGPELHWDDSVSQTPKALESYRLHLIEQAARDALMLPAVSAVNVLRAEVRSRFGGSVSDYYARHSAEYRALRDLKASRPWNYEQGRYIDRAADAAANTGD